MVILCCLFNVLQPANTCISMFMYHLDNKFMRYSRWRNLCSERVDDWPRITRKGISRVRWEKMSRARIISPESSPFINVMGHRGLDTIWTKDGWERSKEPSNKKILNLVTYELTLHHLTWVGSLGLFHDPSWCRVFTWNGHFSHLYSRHCTGQGCNKDTTVFY